MTAAEFAHGDFNVDYYIDQILVRGQPCIAAGASKTLKTSIVALDLSISLASGKSFLNRFPVNRLATCCVLSGESGLPTLQETAIRIARSKGLDLTEIERWHITHQIPNLTSAQDIAALEHLVTKDRVDVLIIDPAYLAMGVTGNQAANMFEMGRILSGITQLADRTHCTPIILHHFRQTAGRGKRAARPDLSDLAYAGFEQFARQWLLFSRCRPYKDDGRHSLWFRPGGSAGHSQSWKLDIQEGMPNDPGGRRWDVQVTADNSHEPTTVRPSQQTARNREADRTVTAALAALDQPATVYAIKRDTAMSEPRIKSALDRLAAAGDVRKIDDRHYALATSHDALKSPVLPAMCANA